MNNTELNEASNGVVDSTGPEAPPCYRWQDDTWLIYGVRYSGESLRWLAQAQGETYRVTRDGETVTMERVPETKKETTP